ncbi:EamA family transporter [Microcoleus sp. FACHB-831]|jgi:drug/metabolite transporter (DMT)-like permease|uniref:EamA family transporter n=1 Tax=Microcoleus sp. FACHB-831 TaxID=2692827 RepID=UPI001688D0C8|nr:EamA family transporter [Microcoleus sp. FACHB-831]MBD1919967.1 EamA family transporter [Microcoleus sp. FACHB-831]
MLGYLLIIAGNASLAIGILFIRLLTNPKDGSNQLNPFFVTSLVAVSGAIILSPILFSHTGELIDLLRHQKIKVVHAVLAGLFYIAMGELLFNIGLSKLDENALSQSGLLALSFPIFAGLAGYIFFKETINIVRFSIAFILMAAGFLVFVSGK